MRERARRGSSSTSSVSRGAVRSEPLSAPGDKPRKRRSRRLVRHAVHPSRLRLLVRLSSARRRPGVSDRIGAGSLVRQAVQPAAMRWFGSPVAEIKQISAYSCRGMNGQRRAHISEHAFGNALDIAAFTLGRRPQDHGQGRLARRAGRAGLPARRARRGLRAVHHGAGARLERQSLRPYPRRPDAASSGWRICNPARCPARWSRRVRGGRYVARRPGEITGSVNAVRHRRGGPGATRTMPGAGQRALPMAEPGNDGRTTDTASREGQLQRGGEMLRGRPAPRLPPTAEARIRSDGGGGPKLNRIGLNSVDWQASMNCAAAISQSSIASSPASTFDRRYAASCAIRRPARSRRTGGRSRACAR